MKTSKGTIKADAITLIPFLLYLSKSRITNGSDVSREERYDTSGLMYSVHITPFFMISFTIPVSRIK